MNMKRGDEFRVVYRFGINQKVLVDGNEKQIQEGNIFLVTKSLLVEEFSTHHLRDSRRIRIVKELLEKGDVLVPVVLVKSTSSGGDVRLFEESEGILGRFLYRLIGRGTFYIGYYRVNDLRDVNGAAIHVLDTGKPYVEFGGEGLFRASPITEKKDSFHWDFVCKRALHGLIQKMRDVQEWNDETDVGFYDSRIMKAYNERMRYGCGSRNNRSWKHHTKKRKPWM